MESVATFEVYRYCVLDENSNALDELPDFATKAEILRLLYHFMVLTRTFDAKAIALQRTGRLGTFASSLGQEAVAVALGSAMAREDVLLPSFREQGAQLLRGVRMEELLAFWGGDERGSDFAGPRTDFPICIPVGSHAAHAAGVALALKLRGEKRAAVCVLGDGATSKGDFYEAINFAGLWRLPLVFVVNNNEWAISVPRSEQSAAATLAQKAIAAGITGEQVDGNDVIGLKARLEKALELARNGNGPILIEALTYRLGDHTTADDARRYRSEEKVSARWKAEPIARLRNFMVAKGFWTKQDEEKLLRECQDEVNEAADRFLQREPQPPVAMFDFLYERLPAALEGQHMMLLKEHESFNQPGRGENG